MDENRKQTDVASEPVDIQDEDELTDTGVLYERPEKKEGS